MLFDTHAHLDDRRFDPDREALLARLPEQGIGLLMNPGCDLPSSRPPPVWPWPIPGFTPP